MKTHADHGPTQIAGTHAPHLLDHRSGLLLAGRSQTAIHQRDM